MADIEANIGIDVDATKALASIRQLQREISAFHTSMAKGGALANAESSRLSQNLVNSINASGKFSASMTSISSSTESFTNALEKNKFSMGQYFKYAGGSSRTFGKMFAREFDTISRVATERVKDLQTQYISMGRDANGALQSIKVRPLALDMDNLGTKVMLASQKQQIFNQVLKQGTTNLLNFGKNTQWAGRQLMVGFTIPLTIFGATAIKEFKKIEEQAVKFKRVYGDMFNTDAETEKALDNVRQLAEEFTKYGIAVEKTIGLAAKVAQMGNTGRDLTEQVTQATKLAVLGGLEQEEALDTTISLTNAFGIAAEDLAGKIAFLNAAENQTILSIEDFNTAIPKAGSVVQQLGGDVEDLAFFLTAMREGGINASEGANALKTSLARLVNPTEVAKKEMAGFGIDIVGIVEKNAGNLQQTIVSLGSELDKLDPLNRARAIEQLFGKFQFARMSTMFQNISKEGSQANKVLALTAATTEELAIVAERELKRVEESPAFKLQKQIEKLQAALAPIGEEFVKAILPVVEFGTKLLKAFNGMGEGGKQFIVVLAAIAGVVAPAALMAFGLVANGIANLIKLTKFLFGAFGMLSGKTTLLGGQTEYMTQQQLEAAAVAASLGQSHNSLTQIFTAEASAIRGLTEAYRQAVVAQGMFRGTSGGIGSGGRGSPRGAYPRRFATGGIIRGPGTGTSDSIFAMISNGEAVIPAAMVKKYGPFVESIIADNVPGYSEGNFKMPSVGAGETRGYTNAVALLSGEGNAAAKNANWNREDALSELKTGGEAIYAPILSEVARRMGATSQAEIEAMVRENPEFAQFAKQLSGGVVDAVADGTGDVSDPELYAAADAQRPSKTGGYSPEFAGAVDDVFDTVTVVENNATKRLNESRTRVKSMGRQNISTEDVAYDSRARGYEDLAETLPGTVPDDWVLAHLTQNKVGTIPELLGDREPTASTALLGERLDQGVEVVRDARTGTSFEVEPGTQLAGAKAKIEELEKVGIDGAQGLIEGASGPGGLDNGSPSRKMRKVGEDGAQGLIDGATQKFDEAKAKGDASTLPGLAPPPPPVTPEAPMSKTGKFLSNLKGKAGSIGNKAMDAALETGPGKKVANYFAETSGANITNSQGKIVSTLHQEVKELGDAADRAADQVEENTEAVKENGKAAASSKGGKNDTAVDGDGSPILGADGKPLTNKQVKAEAGRQKRQKRAGVAAGIMGTATMAVGMATQLDAEVLGFNVGELAQKFMPLIGGVAVLGPMLLAMSGPAALIVLALVGVGAAYLAYQKKLKEVTEAARKLGESLGAGAKAMGTFAEVAGKATATEIMTERRSAGTIGTAIGKSEFGETFVAGEQGKQFVESIKNGMEELGKSDILDSFTNQLATAVYSNVLTKEQAAGIAVEVGRAVGDLQLGIDVAGELVSLVGPDGEDILVNGLSVPMKLIALGAEDVQENLDNMLERASDLGGTLKGWFDFSDEEAQARLAGSLVAYNEQMQQVLDAQELQSQEREKELRDQAQLLRQQGKIAEAEEASLAADKVRSRFLKDRNILLQEFGEQNSKFATMGGAVNSIVRELQSVNFTPLMGGDLDPDASNYDAYIEQMNRVKGILNDYEAFTGIDLGDIDSMGAEELMGVWQDNSDKVEALTTQADGFNKTLEQMGQVVKDRYKDNEDVANQIDNLLSTSEDIISFEVKTSILTDLGTGVLNIGELSKFFADAVTDAAAIGQEEIDAYRRRAERRGSELSDDAIKERIIANNKRIQDAYASVSSKIGGGAAQQLVQTMNLIDDEATRQKLSVGIQADIDSGDIDKAEATIQIMRDIATIDSQYLNPDLTVDFYLNNPDELADYQDTMQRFDDVVAEFADADGVIRYQTVIEENVIRDPGALALLKADQAYFDSLSPYQQSVYMKALLTVEDTFTAEEFNAWLSSNPQFDNSALSRSALQALALADYIRDIVGDAGLNLDLGGDETLAPTTDSGAAPQIDSLIKKLRDLRNATVDMKKGWEGMQEVLGSIFAGGTKQMGMFNGLEKQIRSLGIGEGLIAQIVGMDPDEYEKRKNELFEFNGLGNITKAKGNLLNMNAAFDAVAIGDYVNGQEKFIVKTNNQIKAVGTLTANGMSLADAYKVIQDEATAAAIAQGASTEQIKEIIRVTELAKEAEAELEKEREKSRISEAVRKTNEEFSNQVAVLQKLSKEQGKYSDNQIKAIMSSSDLQKLMLDPTIDPDALTDAVNNAEQQANLEVQINLLTKEGQQTELSNYASTVSDYFSKEENVISLDFELATADDNKIITDAQNQIEDIQYKLDDYNAELEQISWLEEDINEKYDKRSEALDSIAEANDRISQQQKAQLSIADALSQGDIAAAARAVQDLREQDAGNYKEDQKTMLDRARQAELDAVRGPGGMTRKELEETITELERQVFLIEEQSMEPAQERIRLAEVAKNLAIERLELEGKSKMEWEQISASTALAAMSMEDMVLAAKKMAALSEFIKTGEKGADWDELFPQPMAAAASSGGGGGGGGSAPTGKANWPDTKTGKTLQELAGNRHWTEYYNENRGLDTSLVPASGGGLIGMAMGGSVKGYPMGGLIPYKSEGGFFKSLGSDTIPAMLTPGEFVVRRPAVRGFGVDNLEKINSGSYADGSVYTYNLAVNVNSDSDPSRIARAVMTQIKRVDSQRIRTNKL